MIGNAAKNVGKPGLRVEAVELCRFDQGMAPLTGADIRSWLLTEVAAFRIDFRCSPTFGHRIAMPMQRMRYHSLTAKLPYSKIPYLRPESKKPVSN